MQITNKKSDPKRDFKAKEDCKNSEQNPWEILIFDQYR
jgi:hypothetical protein